MSDSNQISTMKNFFSGGFGGICLVSAGHPLDTVKVRMQTMPVAAMGQTPLYNGTFDCVKKIVSNEGILGLYKGMATPLVGVTPMYSICFFGYSLGLKLQNVPANSDYTPLQIFNAGMLSAVFTTPLNGPGERVKCLLQVQAADANIRTQYKGPLDCAAKLYKNGGLRSLFRGTYATLLRDVPGNGIYFMTYEVLKSNLRASETKELGVLQTLFAGGMAGICFWLVAIPFDVLKSRLQTSQEGQYRNGMREVFGTIIKHEGINGLYKGSTAVLLRAFPANAACFFGYELAMKFISWIAPNL